MMVRTMSRDWHDWIHIRMNLVFVAATTPWLVWSVFTFVAWDSLATIRPVDSKRVCLCVSVCDCGDASYGLYVVRQFWTKSISERTSQHWNGRLHDINGHNVIRYSSKNMGIKCAFRLNGSILATQTISFFLILSGVTKSTFALSEKHASATARSSALANRKIIIV